MGKSFVTILSVLSFAGTALAADIATPKSDTTLASADGGLDNNKVQTCLDDIRRKKAEADRNRPPQTGRFVPARASELPNQCVNGDLNAVKTALTRQLAACKQPAPLSQPNTIKFGCRTLSRDQWCMETNHRMLDLANAPHATYQSFMQSIRDNFDWYKNSGRTSDAGNVKKGDVLFTGYDAPEIDASATPNDEYRYPIYRTPANLENLADSPGGSCGAGQPNSCGVDPISGKTIYWCLVTKSGCKRAPTRAEIDNGALKGQEVGYVKSALASLDMMMEGSSILKLKTADGGVKRVPLNYAGENGWPANNLDRLLNCANVPKEDRKSRSTIQNYFDHHPGMERALIEKDQAFVFYRENVNPTGYGGVELTSGVSYATDLSAIPLGSAMVVNFKLAGKSGPNGCKSKTEFASAEDKGGQIGLAHVDRYAGTGPDARKVSIAMNGPGSLFVAVVKPKPGEKIPEKCD